MEIKDENKASIVPASKGGLAKTSNSIAVTKKIISESPHEFHGDFEGKKIWEIQTGGGNLIIYKDVLLVHNKNIFIYNKDTGQLVGDMGIIAAQSIVFSKQFDDNEGYMFCIEWRPANQYPPGDSGYYLFKYSHFLPATGNRRYIKSTIICSATVEELAHHDVKVEVTHDNRYIVTTHRDENGLEINFWDITSLENLYSIAFAYGQEVVLNTESNLFLVLSRTSLGVFDMAGCFGWRLQVFEYSMSNNGFLISLFREEGEGELFNDDLVQELSYNGDLNSNDLVEHPYNIAYNPKLKLILRKAAIRCVRGVYINELETGREIRTFVGEAGDDSEFKFSNTGNYLMETQMGGIYIYDTKTFKLLFKQHDSYVDSYEGHDDSNDNYSLISLFDLDDSHIYTLCDKGILYKWK